jgi:hypothetical protein
MNYFYNCQDTVMFSKLMTTAHSMMDIFWIKLEA